MVDDRWGVFGDAPIGMAVTTPQGVVIQTNAALGGLLGRTEVELAGHDLLALAHPEDAVPAALAVASLRDGGPSPARLECRLRHADGHHLHTLITTSRVPARPSAPAHLVMHVLDISEQVARQSELAHRALHDALTGLPNRTLFVDRLNQALGRARRSASSLAVLFCDLDHFKEVNDTFGHDVGDRVLGALAVRIEGLLRPGDTAARIGGDEFTLLCDDTDLVGAERIAERMTAAVAEPLDIGGHVVQLSVSIGVVAGDGAHGDAAALLRDADLAMYAAKARGRAQHATYDGPMRADARERRALEAELRGATDAGQLELHYQPVIDLTSGRARSVEALLRWRHPERGMLVPAQFIGVAEESGLLLPIGRWVLAEAAAQTGRWMQAGPLPTQPPASEPPTSEPPTTEPPATWVNVSARQLNAGLILDLEEVLDRHPLPPGSLGLELTESALMGDLTGVRPLLERIKALGVRLAVDDFGTGWSSLAYLAELTVDTVKIDRRFTAALTAEGNGVAVVAAILALASSLELDTVVEGVETAEQLEVLRDLGVTAIQGHYIARPEPSAHCVAPGGSLAVHRG